LGIMAPWLIIW